MSITAINEQLLRAVGVGVAIFGAGDRKLKFFNEVFGSWFENSAVDLPIGTLFGDLDLDALDASLDATGQHVTETSLRKRRRVLVIAQTFSPARIGEEDVLVLECQNISRIRELEAMIESYSAMVERNTRDLKREKEQVEKLLLNVMPKAAYEEYKSVGVVTPQRYDDVSVLVLDFVNFEEATDAMPPATFVSELNELYSAFDRIGEQFGCERIKTTGDTYLCIAGMHSAEDQHRVAIASAAIRFVRFLNRRNQNADQHWHCRIGLGAGPVIGSVVGVQKYVYDVFGFAVNAAQGARAFADPMEVLASPEMADGLRGALELGAAKSTHAQDDGIASVIT